LADSFLQGRLWIDGSRPWIERVPVPGTPNEFYLPFPPIPALVLVPVVALLGPDTSDTNVVCAIVGAASVLLLYELLLAVPLSSRARALLTLWFAFGSEFFYIAATGGVHHWSEVLVVFFFLGRSQSGHPWQVGLGGWRPVQTGGGLPAGRVNRPGNHGDSRALI
jgi:hypothetical protein